RRSRRQGGSPCARCSPARQVDSSAPRTWLRAAGFAVCCPLTWAVLRPTSPLWKTKLVQQQVRKSRGFRSECRCSTVTRSERGAGRGIGGGGGVARGSGIGVRRSGANLLRPWPPTDGDGCQPALGASSSGSLSGRPIQARPRAHAPYHIRVAEGARLAVHPRT